MLSIRTKLTIWYLLIISLALIAFGASIYFYLSRSMLRIIDASLTDQAGLLARNYLSDQGALESEPARGHTSTARIVPQFVQYIDGNGQLVDEIKDAAGHSLPLSPDIIGSTAVRLDTLVINNEEQVRVATYPVRAATAAAPELYIRVGQSLLDLQKAQRRLLWQLAISIPLMMVIASLGGLFLANRALRPVERVAQAARRIGAGNLRERVAVPAAGDEISRLAALFNEMIDRLEQAFERERRFTADASHELRTPLAVLRGELELALRKERTGEQYREVLTASLEEIIRLSKLVDDLLTLARSERGELALDRQPLRLDELAAQLCHYIEPLAEAKGLTLEYCADEITIVGDEMRLRQLLLNLLDNAIKYTPAGGTVSLRLKRDEHVVSIEVADTGTGIPREEQALIFERFYRQQQSRTAVGFGLGLAICKWITEAHGGSLTVNSEPGRGSQFLAAFPI